jgi:4-hydroxyphenylpyruvate dioxygenase
MSRIAVRRLETDLKRPPEPALWQDREVTVLRSIATVCLSGGLQEKLYAIAAAGFDAVEIFEDDLTFYDGSTADLRRLLDELSLSVSLFQPFFDFEAVDDARFAKSLARAEHKFDLMGELGAPMMLVSANSSATAIADEARAAAQLNALAGAAGSRGLRLGYEALAWAPHVRTWRDASRIVERADHPALGVILDSFHTLAAGDTPPAPGEIRAEKIAYVQLSDAPKLDMSIVTIGRHFRCLPGQGDLDVAGFAGAALAAGYSGPLSIEVFNDDLRAAPVRATAQEAMRSLLFVEENVARRATVGTLSATSSRDLNRPEPAPEALDIAFLEFSVDAESGADLGAWLEALGFVRAGRHRSKAVTLYRQGEALIALNAGGDSFAHAYFRLHGPSVCAIGIKVADREALLRRAAAYGYKQHHERTEPGEYAMPAIRMPDGSLLHLVDAGFDTLAEFELEPGSSSGAAGLTRFDHIGRAVPAALFDTWLLYFRILLGLEPEDSWELPDPNGLVRSRAMSDARRRIRFPLSFSESNRTMIARALSTFHGAGVNQIALETDDIFASVSALRARGARLLPIPSNYYAELAADTDLTQAEIERLRAHGALFDQDGRGGRFLHAYTETFDGRCFFEVVQRFDGYDQYGAANAPVRMSAQARHRAA